MSLCFVLLLFLYELSKSCMTMITFVSESIKGKWEAIDRAEGVKYNVHVRLLLTLVRVLKLFD